MVLTLNNLQPKKMDFPQQFSTDKNKWVLFCVQLLCGFVVADFFQSSPQTQPNKKLHITLR
jgi:hypothetical protein